MNKDDKYLRNPVIFVGTGRSGTTIISKIIMRHPDLAFPSNHQNRIYSIPSVNLLRRLIEPRSNEYQGKSYLSGYFRKLQFKPHESFAMWKYLTGPEIDFSRGFLIRDTTTASRRSFIRRYFARMVRYQDRKRLCFKITGPSRIGYLLSIFPDATFINLRRNMIPTISSFLKVAFWKERGLTRLWWHGAYTDTEIRKAEQLSAFPELITAFQLNKILEVTNHEVNAYHPHYTESFYENFVLDPMLEIEQLLQFCSLKDNSAPCFSYLSHTTVENRNKPDAEYFSSAQLASIEEILQTHQGASSFQTSPETRFMKT